MNRFIILLISIILFSCNEPQSIYINDFIVDSTGFVIPIPTHLSAYEKIFQTENDCTKTFYYNVLKEKWKNDIVSEWDDNSYIYINIKKDISIYTVKLLKENGNNEVGFLNSLRGSGITYTDNPSCGL